MNKTPLLPVLALTAVLLVPAVAVAESIPNPTAKISSTRGSGAAGCVQSAKRVRFTIVPNWLYYTIHSATVQLDGRRIASRTYSPGSSILAKSFVATVNLSGLSAGRHTLKLTGMVGVPAGRRAARSASVYTPAMPPSHLGKVVQTARITKCVAFTG